MSRLRHRRVPALDFRILPERENYRVHCDSIIDAVSGMSMNKKIVPGYYDYYMGTT
jgi:hypothetical protein